MLGQSFIEIWSLSYDDNAWVEVSNRLNRVWAAFQLRFFMEHGWFPSRDGDVDGDILRYLAEQLGQPAPDPAGYLTAGIQEFPVHLPSGFQSARMAI